MKFYHKISQYERGVIYLDTDPFKRFILIPIREWQTEKTWIWKKRSDLSLIPYSIISWKITEIKREEETAIIHSSLTLDGLKNIKDLIITILKENGWEEGGM